MSIDKVKPLKFENPANGGTQIDVYPTEANPDQDYLTAKGFSFENSDTRKIDLNASGQIQVQDAVETTPLTITQLRTAQNNTFNNTGTNFTSTNVQDAIIESLTLAEGHRFQYAQFQLIGTMNYDQYLVSGSHIILSGFIRSGNTQNGYHYTDCAPITACFTGNVKSAAASIRGMAYSTGTPASSLQLKFELWKVGFSSEGTKLGDIIFNVTAANYTLGNYWNSSIVTAFKENQSQNVNVTAGDLLALKFISQTGNNKIVSIENTTIVLEIIGDV